MAQVFISYKHVEPDRTLAAELAEAIRKRHQVFIDSQIPLGKEWGDIIDEHLGSADFLTALMSEGAIRSPMVLAEIEQAHQLNVAKRRPGIIPIRLKFDGPLRYPLSAYVNRFQQCTWDGPADTPRVSALILEALEAAPEKRRPAAQRQAMIKRVRADWIKGVLEKSLYQAARINLGLKTQPGAVERGIDLLIQRPEEEPQPLSPGVPLLSLFDDQLGQLLILGAPGSGKSTLLLELARDLLDRAEQDESQPIPVVFNLSSWSHRPVPLAKWMAEELRLRSDVPGKLGREWVEQEQILPLLDGLDEVAADHREACVQAINAYRAEHGLVEIAVCSRIAEYEALTAKLRLPGAVAVQPLTRSQIEEYLRSAGAQLEGVRTALQADEGLWELLETPLMISIVALAYKDQPAKCIESVDGSIQNRREQLFSGYVREMFKRRAKETRFTVEQVQRWVSWLASRMVARGQTLFQVEDLRSDWVGLSGARTVSVTCILVIATVLSGVIGWLSAAGFYFSHPSSLKEFFFFDDWQYHLFLMAPLGFVHAILRARSARAVEVLEPHWPGFTRFLLSILMGSALGGVLGYVLGMTGCAIEGGNREEMFEFGRDYSLAGIVAFGVFGAVSSLVRARVATARSSPNLAVYNSLRSSLVCFGCAVLASLPFFGISAFKDFDNHEVAAFLVLGGCFLPWIGLFIAMEKGGYFLLDHFATRYILRRLNLLPWQLVRLLDTGAERLFLRKVGGSYIFVHRTLLEYFANEHDSSTDGSLGDLAPILAGSVIALPLLYAYEYFILRFVSHVAAGLVAAVLVSSLSALFVIRRRWQSIRSQSSRFLGTMIDLGALLLVGAAIGLLVQCVFIATTNEESMQLAIERVTGGSIALAIAATGSAFVAMRVGTLIAYGLFKGPISNRVAQILTGSAMGMLVLTGIIIMVGGANDPTTVPKTVIHHSTSSLWITLVPVLIGLACVFTKIDASEYAKGDVISLFRSRRLGKALTFLVLALAAVAGAIPLLPTKTLDFKFSESRSGNEIQRVIPVTKLPQLIPVQIDEPRVAKFNVPESEAGLGYFHIKLWRGAVPLPEDKAIKSLSQRTAFDYASGREMIDEFLSPGKYEVIVDGGSRRVPEYFDGRPVYSLDQDPTLYRVLPYLERRIIRRVVRYKGTLCTLRITLKPASPDTYKVTIGDPNEIEYDVRWYSKYRAIAITSSQIKRNPNNAGPYRLRSQLFTWFGDYARSVEDMDHVIDLNPSDADAYIDRGSYYVSLRDYEKALSDLNVAVRLNPRNPLAYRIRAGIYNDLAIASNADKNSDLYKNAIKDANDGLRLASGANGPWWATGDAWSARDVSVGALRERASAHDGIGDTQEAVADMKQALGLSNHPVIYNELGFYLNRLREYDLALTNLNVAVDLDPGFANFYKNRGRALFGLNEVGGAKADFDEAIRLAPSLAETYWFRADLEEKQGDKTLAANDRRKARELRYKPRGAKGW